MALNYFQPLNGSWATQAFKTLIWSWFCFLPVDFSFLRSAKTLFLPFLAKIRFLHSFFSYFQIFLPLLFPYRNASAIGESVLKIYNNSGGLNEKSLTSSPGGQCSGRAEYLIEHTFSAFLFGKGFFSVAIWVEQLGFYKKFRANVFTFALNSFHLNKPTIIWFLDDIRCR